MYMTIRVKLNERVVLFRNGLPFRYLGPGRHRVFRGLDRLTEQRFAIGALLFDALPEVRAMIPADEFREVTIGPDERGVLYRDGRPQAFLRPGVHRYFVVDPSVELRVFGTDAPLTELSDELAGIIPSTELVDVLVREHERGLKYVNGRLSEVLGPGRLTGFTQPTAVVRVDVVDTRRQALVLAGQELMTKDKVTLRLTLTADYPVTDPAKAAQATVDVRDAVYTIVQLAARDYVAAVTLDQLLEGRDAMTRYLEDAVRPKGDAVGVAVDAVGVRDVVLPGEMKALLNRVIEAEKEAAASVISRREETAATRALAQTAKVMADHPVHRRPIPGRPGTLGSRGACLFSVRRSTRAEVVAVASCPQASRDERFPKAPTRWRSRRPRGGRGSRGCGDPARTPGPPARGVSGPAARGRPRGRR